MGFPGALVNPNLFFRATLVFCCSSLGFSQETPGTNAVARNEALQTSSAIASSFIIEKGFRIELVTTESMVASPVAMAFDERGRLFVVEMRDYPEGRARIPHLGRVRMLEDSDGDGIFDSATVYADNLPWPSAVACYNGGIFVAATPEILYFKDLKGNGVADERKVVFTGFGPTGGPTNAEMLINSFVWGWDNRIHGGSAGIGGVITSVGAPSLQPLTLGYHDFSFDPRLLTILPESGSAQTGLTFDNWGRKFFCDLTHPLRSTMYDVRYYNRNPWVVRPPESLDVVAPGTRIFRLVSEESRQRAPGRPAGGRSILGSDTFTAKAMTRSRGCLIYRGSAFPTNYLGNVFIAEPEAHLIHRSVVVQNGLTTSTRRPADEPNTEFLMGKDASFHPVQIVAGPEGGIYIADMERGGESGRIFRIVPSSFKQSKPPRLGGLSNHDLVAALSSPNGWHRDTAARLLYERKDSETTVLLTNVFNNSRFAYARLHALSAMDGLKALTEGVLMKGLGDPDEHVREHAIALCERRVMAGKISDKLWARLALLTADPAIQVRSQLAFTLGEIIRPERTRALGEVLQRDVTNLWSQAAVLSSVSKGAPELMALLASDSRWRNDPVGLAYLRQLATLIGVRGQNEEVTQTLYFINNAGMDPLSLFTILGGIGEGLHRIGSSLAVVDTQGILQPIFDRTLDVALNDSLPDALRVTALHLRGLSSYASNASGDIFQLLFGTGQSEAIQAAAIATLGRYESPTIATNLFLRWPELNPRLRRQVTAALLTRVERVPDVVTALENGAISPADLTPVHANFLRTFRDPVISQRASRILGPVSTGRPALLGQYRDAVRSAGVAARGREIFLARCSSCHTLGGGDLKCGPDLAAARFRGKEKLLSDILQPGAEVAPDYVTYVLESRQGENLIGALGDEDPTTFTLCQPEQAGIVWPRRNLETLQAQPWSLMPDGFEMVLTPSHIGDLLEYLTAFPPDPTK